MDTNERKCKTRKLFASIQAGFPLALTRKTASDSVRQIYAEVRKRRAIMRLPFQTCTRY